MEASPRKAVERAAAARPSSSARSFARIAARVAPSEREIASRERSPNDSPVRFINDADPDLDDGGDPYEAISLAIKRHSNDL